MRKFLLLLSFFGVIFFGGAFAISFVDPLLVERAAREVVRFEIESRVGEKIDELSNTKIAKLAEDALRKTNIEVERSQAAIREQVPRKIANVIADMLNADCECRRRLVAYAQAGERAHFSMLTLVKDRLRHSIESAYASVTAQLMREFRIFTASNAIAFLLLAAITWFRRASALQLCLPAFVLIGAVSVTGSLYLFKQDWLHTIIYGEYLGLAYSLYLVVVAFLFFDVVFNRAKISTRLVNILLQAIGSAVSAAPC